MGFAGSLATMAMETTHHFMDTVNIRSKVSKTPISSMGMASKIYAQEGIYGFSKGFSACYYGSIACGFIYFSLYKLLKTEFRNVFGDNQSLATTCFVSSFFAEMITLFVYFPYDMVKCRLQSRNNIFKYKNLVHAFKTEVQKEGIQGLYRGALPFLITYTTTVSI